MLWKCHARAPANKHQLMRLHDANWRCRPLETAHIAILPWPTSPEQATSVPQRRSSTRCQAAASGTAAAPHAASSVPRPKNALLVTLVEALFRFPPFFAIAAKNVRGPWVCLGMERARMHLSSVAGDCLGTRCVRALPGAPQAAANPGLVVLQAREIIVKRGESMGLDFQVRWSSTAAGRSGVGSAQSCQARELRQAAAGCGVAAPAGLCLLPSAACSAATPSCLVAGFCRRR